VTLTDAEKQAALNDICQRILHTRLNKKAALEIKRQINDFCKENAITVEERRIFIDTGAGDTLEMICSIPDKQDGEKDTL